MDFVIEPQDLAEAKRRLHAAIEKHGTQQAFAKAHGINHSLVSQVVRGRVDPPPQVLLALGLRRIVKYVDINEVRPQRRFVQDRPTQIDKLA